MSKHTPGPWIRFTDEGKTVAIMPAGRPGDVCRFEKGSVSAADASLIASAPDLLAACKAALLHLTEIMDGHYGEHRDNPVPSKLRAAIAKAEPK